MEEPENVKCSRCDEVVPVDESYEHDNDIYCSYCWHEESEICFLCEEEYHYEDFSNIMFVPDGYCGESEWKPVWRWDNIPKYRLKPGYYGLLNRDKANCQYDVVMNGHYTFSKGVFLRPPFGDFNESFANTCFFDPTENAYMICERCKEERFSKNYRRHNRSRIKREAKKRRASFNTGVYYYLLTNGKLDLIPSLGAAIDDIQSIRRGIDYARDMLYRKNEKRRSLIFSCYHCKEVHPHRYVDGRFVCTNCGEYNYSSCHLKNFEAKKKDYSKEEPGLPW
jgi:hypothetical protein